MADNSDIRIIRSKRGEENPYFMMRRATAQDENLTFEEVGLLTYLLSKPDNWRINAKDLQKNGGVGKDKVYKLLKSLAEKGYILRTVERDEKTSRFTRYIYDVYEAPVSEQEPLPDFPETESPETDFPDAVNTDTYILKKEDNTDSTDKREEKKELSTIVDAQPENIYTWDVLIDVVRDTFQVYGANEQHIANMLLGRSKKGKWGEYKCNLDLPLDKMIQAVVLFKHWYSSVTDGLTIPQEADKINSWFTRFIQSDEGKQWRKVRGGAILADWLHSKQQVNNTPDWDAQEHLKMVDELYKEIVG